MRRTLLAIAAVAIAGVALSSRLDAQSNRWGENYFPNLPVVTQDGETVRFYDDLIKGRIVVISFIYTSCTDICPLTTARMTQVEDKLGDLVGRKIFFYSMTVDPEHDTPEKMKQFADAFHAGPGWKFLTGTPADVRAINAKLGDRSRTLSEHRNEIVIGNDATGEWMRNSLFGDLDRVVMDILAMDPAVRDQPRIPAYDAASDTGYSLGTVPGQALFKKVCAPCHTIGVGDRVGPDLRGVTARRTRPWLAAFMRDPAKVRGGGDPIAAELAGKFPGVRMPALGLSDLDAADLITYLETETSKISVGAQDAAPHDHGSHHHHH